MASRLSTVGKGILDGNGLGVSDGEDVSVSITVGVAESVCVAVGAGSVNVSVTDENAVFVGSSVSARVGGTEVELQAKEASINKIGKIRLRFINEYALLLEG